MIGIALYTQGDNCSRLSATSFLRCAIVALSIVFVATSPFNPAKPFPLEQAQAATWPLGSSQASVATEFHEFYSYSGKKLLHSGIDIPAKAGSNVSSPVSGTVKFVGDVPSGDSYLSKKGSGYTVRAVSISMEDGRTLTLMPLADITVAKGQVLSEGYEIGTLAAKGDRSSRNTHLHVGLKRGNTYYDPISLFSEFTTNNEPASEVPEEIAAIDESVGSKPAANQPAHPIVTESFAVVESAEVAERDLGTISSGAVQWTSQSVHEESAFLDNAAVAFSGVIESCVIQALALHAGIQDFSQTAGVPAFAVSVILLSALTLLVAGVMRVAVILASALRDIVKNNKNRALYQNIGGDTIHKLFPAPGTSFITRGRSAQRR